MQHHIKQLQPHRDITTDQLVLLLLLLLLLQCSDADCTGPKAGQPGCRFTDPGFEQCKVCGLRTWKVHVGHACKGKVESYCDIVCVVECVMGESTRRVANSVADRSLRSWAIYCCCCCCWCCLAARGSPQPDHCHCCHQSDGHSPDGSFCKHAAVRGTRHG